MESIGERVKRLNAMVLEGRTMEAFDQFYHPDVVMQENDNAPTVGKEANRQRELEFLSNVTDFRGAEVRDVIAGDDISMVVWHYDYTHKEWGVRNYTQASVQHWKDGLIVKEQFFYGI